MGNIYYSNKDMQKSIYPIYKVNQDYYFALIYV